jgi:hypothetical protein
MKIALKMMRDAKNLDYKGCLQNEFNAALNKIEDSDFDVGVGEVLMKPSSKNGYVNPGFKKNISND